MNDILIDEIISFPKIQPLFSDIGKCMEIEAMYMYMCVSSASGK